MARRRRRKNRTILLASLLVFLLAVAAGLYLAADSQSSEKSLARALDYRAQGEIAASIIELKNALKQDPENIAARISLGRIYLDIRDLVSAEKELNRARSLGASADQFAEPLSQTWLIQKNYSKVLDELSPEGANSATQVVIWVAHARAHIGLEQLEDADRAIARALDADGKNPDAWIERARLAIRTNDFATARSALDHLESLAPSNLEVTALRGDLNLRLANFSQAVAEYQKVLESNPAHLPTRVALANALLAEDSDDEASRVLQSALSQVPTNADANYLNSYIAFQNGDYQTALESAENTLRSNPSHLPSLLIAGAVEFSFGRLESAERNMKQVLVTDPDNTFAAELLAAIAERQARRSRQRSLTALIDDTSQPALVAAAVDPASLGRHALAAALEYLDRSGDTLEEPRSAVASEAITYLHEGRAADAYGLIERQLLAKTTDIELLTIAGVASLLMGEANQARLLFRSLEDVDPEAAPVHYLLATAYLRLDNLKSYEERLARSLSLDPGYLPAIGESARSALANNKAERALSLLRSLEKEWAGRPEYHDLAGGVALLRGDLEAAATAYRTALEMAPSRMRALRLAYAEQRLGRAAESITILEDWLGDHPADIETTLVLANKRLASGEYLEAAEAYSVILLQAPDHIVAINNLAWLSLQLGDTEAALRLAQQGLELAPEDPRVMDTLAAIFIAEQNYDDALPLLKRAAQREKSDPGLHVRLAQTLAKTGNRDEARSLLRSVLNTHPQFAEREEAEQLAIELSN